MWRIIGSLLVGGLVIAGILGWFGVSWQSTVGQGYCPQFYKHYAVKPYLHDWWECRRQQPCGVDEDVVRYNAHVEVVQCLCQQLQSNRVGISQYYIQYLSQEPIFQGRENATVEAICATEATPVGRL